MKKCRKCDHQHERDGVVTCKAHKSGSRPPEPCLSYPKKGMAVCPFHGGNSPLARKKAEERLEEERILARAAVELRRFKPVTDANPMTALLDLVQYQSGVVAYWRSKVEQLEDEKELIWGTTDETERVAGVPEGTFMEVKQSATAHITYRLLREAQRDLADYASGALRAGFEERTVSLAERQGELLIGVIRGVLAALQLTPKQQELVPIVVPEQLRLAQRGAR